MDYLNRIYVPEQVLTLGLEHLKQEAGEDDKKHLSIRESLERAWRDCEARLHNLNQMRVKDLIDDTEYLDEKKEIVQEKMRAEENLKDGTGNAKRAADLTENALLFSNQGRERFKNGSPEDKRAVLHGFGSDLFLKEKKLSIQLEKPLLLIGKGINCMNDGITQFAPSKYGLDKGQKGLSPA